MTLAASALHYLNSTCVGVGEADHVDMYLTVGQRRDLQGRVCLEEGGVVSRGICGFFDV